MQWPNVVQSAAGWLEALAFGAGTIVCAVCLERSRWVSLLLGGFVVETTTVLLLHNFDALLLRLMSPSEGYRQISAAVETASGILDPIGVMLIAAGVAGVLFELPRPNAGSRPSE